MCWQQHKNGFEFLRVWSHLDCANMCNAVALTILLKALQQFWEETPTPLSVTYCMFRNAVFVRMCVCSQDVECRKICYCKI